MNRVVNIGHRKGRRGLGKRYGAWASLALLLILAACKLRPTYRADQLAESLKQLCQRDYKLSIEARSVEHNLQALLWRVGLFSPGQLELQPEATEALLRVLLCATRVSLSTDAPIQFLQVKMVDALTGASVTLWRFVPDIKGSMFMRMGEEEYLNRLVVEYEVKEPNASKEWREIDWGPPLTMGEFLAKQVVMRVKRQSTVSLQAHEDLSKPLTLVVVLDNWAALQKQGDLEEEKVTALMEKTARTVMASYQFKGFREFILKDNRGMSLGNWAL